MCVPQAHNIWPGKEYLPTVVTMAQSLPEILKVLSKVFKYETSNSSSDTAKLSTTHPSVVQLHGSLTILVHRVSQHTRMNNSFYILESARNALSHPH